ncbi:MAG: transcription antitermination protein NusB [Bacteroidales bacterium]|nr:transcription antitermination protein NusB [Bacteroidales bacterium]
MLNRRILRIKAFKVIYGHAVTGRMSLEDAYAELDASCEATRDLYLLMLAVIPPLTTEALARIEAARSKFNPTEEELHPNEKFATNALAHLLEDDPDFRKVLSKKKLGWDRYDIFIRDLYDSVREKPYFQKYMASTEHSLAADCRLFIRIFEEEFMENEAVWPILEEQNLYWNDDLAYALTWCCHSLDDIARGENWHLPELYQSDIVRKRKPGVVMDSDRDFVRKLVRCALTGYERYFKRVTASVSDWDSDRLFSTDMAIIACAMAEIENFPEIPQNVSLNEYIEISKFYCSPKSRGFINGLLDRFIKENNKTE